MTPQKWLVWGPLHPCKKQVHSTLSLEGRRILRVEAILIYFVLPIGQPFPIKRRAIWTPGIWQHTTPPPVESKSNRGSERKNKHVKHDCKKNLQHCHNKIKDWCRKTPNICWNLGLESSIRLFETGFPWSSRIRIPPQSNATNVTTFDWTYATSRRRCTNIWCCRSWGHRWRDPLGPIPGGKKKPPAKLPLLGR